MRKSSYSMVFIASFLLLFFTIPTTHAASKQIYQVGVDQLHVRSAPDFDAEIVGQLQAGNQVTAFEEKHGWVQTYYDGQDVWVASQYLIKIDGLGAESQKEAPSNTVKITEDAVHIRKGPGTDQTILAIANKGDAYQLIDTTSDWHQIKLDDGTIAWVASWLTDQPTTDTSTTNNNTSSSKNDNTTNNNAPNSSLSGYNIMLDASHGGKDPGAIGINGEQEKDLALEFTHIVAEKLRNDGATVTLTRANDAYLSLEDRINISEDYWTDAFISLHFNAFTSDVSNGVSTHYYANDADRQLAEHIQNALQKHTNLNNNGVRQDDYHVLRENSDVSVLVELGFLTNSYDLQVIQSGEHSSAVANAISEGLHHYFN